MKNHKRSANITNIQFDKTITFSDKIRYFTEIAEINPIPSNCIINKTVTGIGATHSEIVSKRSSIIVLPHISIVQSKHKKYVESNDTFAIYGGVNKEDIYNYLTKDSEYAKILTTPNGLTKIVEVLRIIGDEIQLKSHFFLLFDECHKLIQDAAYRSDMLIAMELFFSFPNKVMISATPIPPSDPRFKQQNFKYFKLAPDFSSEINQARYIPHLNLIHTNSLLNAIKTYLNENVADQYCIFFNSIEGIKSIINQLEIIDYKIFCSQESSDLLSLDNELESASKIENLKKYNFFTSSFFNGLDIIQEIKPNILIISDYGYRGHTLLDPNTDILQIIGRFRRNNIDELPYNNITHINNSKCFTDPMTEDIALLRIHTSKEIYNCLKTFKLTINDPVMVPYFDQYLSTVKPYSKLITSKGIFSYFLKDNYLSNERVKTYYYSTSSLRSAYVNTQLYKITNHRGQYTKEEIINLGKKSIRYSSTMNELIGKTLLDLENYKMLDVYYDEQQVIKNLSPLVHHAFNRLGYANLALLKFKRTSIQTELLKLDIEQGKNAIPLINIVYVKFRLNKAYTWKEIKEEFINIYEEFDLKCKAKAKDIQRYFEFKDLKRDDDRVYVLTKRKFFEPGSLSRL